MRRTITLITYISLFSLSLFYLAAIWAFSAPSSKWEIAASSPITRFEGSSAVIGDRLYVFAGYYQYTAEDHTLHASNQVHSYDPKTNRWQEHAQMPNHVTHLNPAIDKTDAWFAGGFKGNYPGSRLDEVWKYDSIADTWSPGPPLPDPRGGGALVRVGRYLHYIGGYYYQEQEPSAPDHWALNLDNPTAWETKAELPISRGHMGFAVIGENIYFLGGATTHHPRSYDSDAAHVYDSRTDSWTQIANLPSPRSHTEPGSFAYKGKIYLVGGRDNQSKNLAELEMDDIIRYDPQTNSWTQVATLPIALRAPAAQIIGDVLIVTNGSSFLAEKPQLTTYLADARELFDNPPQTLALRGHMKSYLKALIRVTPWRIQNLMGLKKIVE